MAAEKIWTLTQNAIKQLARDHHRLRNLVANLEKQLRSLNAPGWPAGQYLGVLGEKPLPVPNAAKSPESVDDAKVHYRDTSNDRMREMGGKHKVWNLGPPVPPDTFQFFERGMHGDMWVYGQAHVVMFRFKEDMECGMTARANIEDPLRGDWEHPQITVEDTFKLGPATADKIGAALFLQSTSDHKFVILQIEGSCPSDSPSSSSSSSSSSPPSSSSQSSSSSSCSYGTITIVAGQPECCNGQVLFSTTYNMTVNPDGTVCLSLNEIIECESSSSSSSSA